MLNDRIYSVFLSSNFREMSEYRKVAIDVIHRLGHVPIAFENFEASSRINETLIREYVEACDVFVLLLGKSSGTTFDGTSTFLELEYEAARKADREILVFASSEPENTDSRLASIQKEAFINMPLNAERARDTIHDALKSLISTMIAHPDLDHLGWVRARKTEFSSHGTTPNPARTGDFFDQLRTLNSAMKSLSDEISTINDPERLDASVRATKAYLDSFAAFLSPQEETASDNIPEQVPKGLSHWLRKANWSGFSSQARGWVETILKLLEKWPWQ